MKTETQQISNQVLEKDARSSTNFFQSDLILQDYLSRHISQPGWELMFDKWMKLGSEAAGKMNELSLLADHKPPELIKRDALGRDINEIRFHPAYWDLMKIAVESDMLRVKWEPELRRQFSGENHSLGFAAFYLFAMSELGQHCPLAMTDGAALLLDRFAEQTEKDRLLEHIFTTNHEDFWTGCMFMTEKSGGSDVGRNLVAAKHLGGDQYLLNGEKWFCSNANGEIIFTLARTDESVAGIRGLSLFLVEKYFPDGSRNPMNIVRLKDKLGVRSMASAECIFRDTRATLIGQEFMGFKQMVEMVNLSRIHNAMAAVAGGRRALIEAYQFLSFRTTFGKNALDHALVRAKFQELAAIHCGSFYLLWRAISAFDKAQTGDQQEAQLLRLLTPMLKKHTAETAVYLVRESMELMGGMGYIEDVVLPKIMRDVLVLPIWEGTSNIQVLDMLRASVKSDGLALVAEMIWAQKDEQLTKAWNELLVLGERLERMPQDEREVQAKYFFERLTLLVQMALLARHLEVPGNAARHPEVSPSGDADRSWIALSLRWFRRQLAGEQMTKPASREEVESMLGWVF